MSSAPLNIASISDTSTIIHGKSVSHAESACLCFIFTAMLQPMPAARCITPMNRLIIIITIGYLDGSGMRG